jgi:hypothetical protein
MPELRRRDAARLLRGLRARTEQRFLKEEQMNTTTLENPNPFALSGRAEQPQRSMIETASTRQAQEVQAAMVIAKKFPRDQVRAFDAIMRACSRPSLAEEAQYAYPRGGETVTGPSIRLAECLAQNWGNLDFGIIELEQKAGESIVMAYAWDLETNTRQTKVFTVAHERHKKGGQITKLTDPRDIYEMTANQGARRLRACILGVIPGDLVEAAVAECDKTLRKQNKEPLIDRVRKMVGFYSELGVTQAMIEKRIRKKLEAITEPEFFQLRKIYSSIRDGMGKREDYFEPAAETPEGLKADDVPMPTEPPASNIAPTTPPPEPKKPKRESKSSAPNPLETIRGLMTADEILEGDIIELGVRKNWFEPIKGIGELTIVQLNDLIEQWDFVVAQTRIDRKGRE